MRQRPKPREDLAPWRIGRLAALDDTADILVQRRHFGIGVMPAIAERRRVIAVQVRLELRPVEEAA